MRPIALLNGFKLRNGLRTILSDPRKLIPLVIFIAIMGIFAGLTGIAAGQRNLPGMPEIVGWEMFGIGTKVGLILISFGFIESGLGDTLLAFSASDLDYLFPSPIPRRAVLIYRLPGLMFNSLFTAGFLLFAFNAVAQVGKPKAPMEGHEALLWWAPPLAIFFAAGIYMNLSMFIAMTVPDRRPYQRGLAIGTASATVLLGLIGWVSGIHLVSVIVSSPVVHWLFLPSSLASEVLLNSYSKLAVAQPLAWLACGYLVSAIPMLTSNANWYEQSIASTERRSSLVSAARGGYASLMAQRAASFKYQSAREYTLRPFGQGAVALFWAHMCAATKRPWANFLIPAGGGLMVGIFGAVSGHSVKGDDWASHAISLAAVLLITAYGSLGFMTTAKTASESATRRRELTAPLPIAGWKTVAANLGTPFVSGVLFFEAVALTYGLLQGPYAGLVCAGIALCLPLRLAARMALQYLVGVIYADASDKIQQFFAVGVYGLLAMPFLFVEGFIGTLCVLFGSPWLALAVLTLLQLPLGIGLFLLTGKAQDQAIATGEPVRLWALLKTRPSKTA